MAVYQLSLATVGGEAGSDEVEERRLIERQYQMREIGILFPQRSIKGWIKHPHLRLPA